MINFKSLKLIVNDTYSFVGIEKQDDTLRFCLPKGFAEQIPKLDTFTAKRDLFFLFYKIFETFREICLEKGYLEEVSELGTQNRDGVINSNRGSEIQDDVDNSENIFYSKLDFISRLLNVYDEPKILALVYRLSRSDKFDVSQIHRYLHQAVYLQNNAVYVDQMVLPQRVVQFESTDIITMYCYLFCEIKQQLGEVISAEITALAERFRQHYLSSQDSLFYEHSYEQVLDILKNVLETIDHNTPIKDVDYWQYYEAIELFLYGDWHQTENGVIWGIKNFHSVWESMCLTYLVQVIDPSLLLHLDNRYVSSRTLEKVESSAKVIDLSNLLQINGSQLIPDAIVLKSIVSQVKAEKIYTLSSSKWDDYGYRTSMSSNGSGTLNIAYLDQQPGSHTIEKLKEFYQTDEWGEVIIDAPLPNNFYSFWGLPEQIDFDCLYQMYYFNHFFYLALEKQITDWQRFYKEILQPLGITFGLYPRESKANVFTNSLLRPYCIVVSPEIKYIYSQVECMKKSFDDFIKDVFDRYDEFFEIIDIKYLTSNYFCDFNNIEDIKRRNVRKQFVYEHLLQKVLEHKYDKFSNFSIHSSFWLPSYRPDDSDLLENGSTFIDGYIQLKNVNFIMLAKSYFT